MNIGKVTMQVSLLKFNVSLYTSPIAQNTISPGNTKFPSMSISCSFVYEVELSNVLRTYAVKNQNILRSKS